ncbi:Uncharacterized conserved protein YndB, AHSA1/START domain [Sphingomonas sp. YR710]|jgi:uncharacterized protein YndB with AHSA1/START domain|uniref:SRPBCC family protein n=1 Tax=Sphingomonas sp. YR710 TaxID=1882773 RepID=UPI000891D171|nr:SRPBCC family protein [Sphingomonas sp. YR710]SDC12079.1 Uncharacterized conserved protein YndB, AHSA1/START domain [Sphingomonas sp. YR710]
MNDTPAPLYELSVTRLISASPETVWKVWTERLEEWWAPKPWTTSIIEMDLRAGGRNCMDMIGPDGNAMRNEGVVLEVVTNRRIVFTDAFTAGWKPQAPFMVAIFTFEPEGDGTRYTASARHWNAETLKQHEEMGFINGWTVVAGQLAAIAEGQA